MDFKKLNEKHPAQWMKVDQKRALDAFVKAGLRNPLRALARRWLGEFYPNVFFSYSDHPLDRDTTALNTSQGFVVKWKNVEACSVLQVDYLRRDGNAFYFRARGYDVYKAIDNEADGVNHVYRTDKVPSIPLTLRIDFLRSDVYRLRLARGGPISDRPTPAVIGDLREPGTEVRVEEGPGCTILRTSRLELRVHHRDFRIETFDAVTGRLIVERGGKTKNGFANQMDAWPLGFVEDKSLARQYMVDGFDLYPGEAVYGLGERFGPVNHVGQTIGQYNYEGLGNTSGRTYKNVPFFWSTRGYGVYYDRSSPAAFWVGTRETSRHQIAIPSDDHDSYFFYGPDPKRILAAYTDLTGKAPRVPLWSFGVWMSRMTYITQEQVLGVAQALRELRMPCDVIHIDTGWFREDWRCDWDFDPVRFPDPAGMVRKAREQGFRLTLWQEPYALEGTSAYDEAVKAGALAVNHGPFAFLYMFPARPIDFSSPAGVSWYKEKLRRLLRMGFAAIKVDFGEQVEPHHQFAAGDGDMMHNLYALLYHKAAFEVTQEVAGKGEALVWARAGWAGCQRYPVPWSGDNSSNYENLLSSLRGGLSLGLSGFTYWSQDTGGFAGGRPDEDVIVRWTQLSIFQSHIRYHAPLPDYNEPWNFSKRTQDLLRPLLELRYRLIPYLYGESVAAAEAGLPLLRHLVLEHFDDPTVRQIEDQFYCGRALLVAPILERTPWRKVYLPKGRWYELLSGSVTEGPVWIEGTWALDRFPVFVRAGSVLPLAQVVQSTNELSYDHLTLRFYPDAEGKAAVELATPKETLRFEIRKDEGGVRVKTSRRIQELVVEGPDGNALKVLELSVG